MFAGAASVMIAAISLPRSAKSAVERRVVTKHGGRLNREPWSASRRKK